MGPDVKHEDICGKAVVWTDVNCHKLSAGAAGKNKGTAWLGEQAARHRHSLEPLQACRGRHGQLARLKGPPLKKTQVGSSDPGEAGKRKKH